MSARLRAWALVGALAAAPPARAADDPADALARAIDLFLDRDWHTRGITPAAPADDAEFCRRVHLDLIGRAPRVNETLAFLEDTAADKRAKLVERLLGTAPHAAHFATVTRANWLPQSTTNPQFAGFGFQLETWLRKQYRENAPADRTVRALLQVEYTVAGPAGAPVRFVQPTGTDPDRAALVSFIQANEAKAENVAAAVSRLFLGVKLECAQCHDHPFAPYTKDQFWEFAAFFGDLNRTPVNRPSQPAPTGPQAGKNRIAVPNSDRVLIAKFFDGTEPVWNEVTTPRQELAAWLTAKTNPYFARNLANRMWAHFFGVGIVDPVDEPGENNPPSHPELLDELAKSFAAGGYDNRLLIRAITRSKAYQLTSRLSHPTHADPRQFARMNLKGLTPAQLFDSLVSATGFREPAQFRDRNFPGFVQPNNPRSAFLNRFASTDRATEAGTTILQALMLMNGDFLDAQTAPDRAELLAAVADMPGWDTKRRVETLFLAALARRPTAAELERYSSHVDRGDPKAALGDVFWVLLNSPEFLFNH